MTTSSIESNSSARNFSFNRFLPFIGVFVLFGVWWLISISGAVNPVLLPTPVATIGTLITGIFTGAMLPDLTATVLRTFSAFLMAGIVGVPVGVALGSSEKLYRSVEFLIDFFRSTPASALIPLFILFFGVSDFSKVVIAAFSAFLLIVFNSAYGVINAKQSRILAAKVMGANPWQVFKDVLLMESLPQTFIGLRSGISISLVIVIVAEMFIGTEQGLGKRIIDAQQILNVKDMYASILVTGILGYFLNMLFLLVEKRFIHWSGK
ncbi:ABC transporter permease [Microcoleus sp. MON2_D5]|uniref:ABC transporter permease n=1 Tax=Microcoleus sp. MON2_D5 TaxID=2818833 RepID=UPI002FD39502